MKFLLRLCVVLMASACISAVSAVDINNAATTGNRGQVVALNPAVTASVLLKAQKVMTGILSSMSLAALGDKQDISGDMKLLSPSLALAHTAPAGAPERFSAPHAATVQQAVYSQPAASPPPAPSTANNESVKLSPAGRVIWVKGTMKAEHEGENERSLTNQSILFVGDKLETGKKTQAEIAFTDTTLVTLNENTIFVIKDYAYHPDSKQGKSIGKFVMDLIAGGFRTITGLIPKGDPNDYKVETPVATIGVRGTDYMVVLSKSAQKGLTALTMEQLKGVPTVSFGNNKVVALTDTDRYVTVEADGSFILSKTRPAILGEPLPIIPATVKPISVKEINNTFATPGSGGWCILQSTGGGGGGSGGGGSGGGH